MMDRLTLLMVVGCLLQTTASQAQRFFPFSVKTDVAGYLGPTPNYQLLLEWRKNGKTGFEVAYAQQRHQGLPQGLFHGNLVAHYALRRTYQTQWGSSIRLHDTGWIYFGDGRPLSDVSQHFFPLNTYQGGLRMLYFYPTTMKGLQFFLKPGLSLTVLDAFRVISDKMEIVSQTAESWPIGAFSIETQAVRETEYFKQTREMRRVQYWMGGVTMGFGFAWQWNNGIRIEPGLMVGIHVGDLPKTDAGNDQSYQAYWGQFNLMVGYAFGL